MKFSSKMLILAVLVISFFTATCAAKSDSEGELKVHFINVGQGDCIFVETPNGKNMLIDAGWDSKGKNIVVPYLKDLGVDSIQYVMVSHYHGDHIAGLNEVIQEINISRSALDRGGAYESDWDGSHYDRYIELVGDDRIALKQGDRIDLDENVNIRIVAASGNGHVDVEEAGENDLSIAMVVSYKDFDVFLGGDLTGEDYFKYDYHDIESYVAEDVGQVEAMKINHHGSSHSSNKKFIETLSPQVAVITCGKNRYGHPRDKTRDVLDDNNVKIYQSENSDGSNCDGHIVITSNGKSFTVQPQHTRGKKFEVY